MKTKLEKRNLQVCYSHDVANLDDVNYGIITKDIFVTSDSDNDMFQIICKHDNWTENFLHRLIDMVDAWENPKQIYLGISNPNEECKRLFSILEEKINTRIGKTNDFWDISGCYFRTFP